MILALVLYDPVQTGGTASLLGWGGVSGVSRSWQEEPVH
jgi:hypothetical protein